LTANAVLSQEDVIVQNLTIENESDNSTNFLSNS